jgi:hypothetical protein
MMLELIAPWQSRLQRVKDGFENGLWAIFESETRRVALVVTNGRTWTRRERAMDH